MKAQVKEEKIYKDILVKPNEVIKYIKYGSSESLSNQKLVNKS